MHVYSYVEIRIVKQKTSVMNNNMHGGIVGLVDGVDELGSEVVRRSEVRFSPSVKLTNSNNILITYLGRIKKILICMHAWSIKHDIFK